LEEKITMIDYRNEGCRKAIDLSFGCAHYYYLSMHRNNLTMRIIKKGIKFY